MLVRPVGGRDPRPSSGPAVDPGRLPVPRPFGPLPDAALRRIRRDRRMPNTPATTSSRPSTPMPATRYMMWLSVGVAVFAVLLRGEPVCFGGADAAGAVGV